MAFFDELGKVLTDKSKEAAGKVRDLTGVIQLKSKLSAEKEKVNQAYITLGKAYYDRHEAALEDEYDQEFQAIRAGLLKIAALEDEIAELEGTRVCAECGARVERDALYCSRCGAAMEQKAPCAGREACGEQEAPEACEEQEAGCSAKTRTEEAGQSAEAPENAEYSGTAASETDARGDAEE